VGPAGTVRETNPVRLTPKEVGLARRVRPRKKVSGAARDAPDLLSGAVNVIENNSKTAWQRATAPGVEKCGRTGHGPVPRGGILPVAQMTF